MISQRSLPHAPLALWKISSDEITAPKNANNNIGMSSQDDCAKAWEALRRSTSSVGQRLRCKHEWVEVARQGDLQRYLVTLLWQE